MVEDKEVQMVEDKEVEGFMQTYQAFMTRMQTIQEEQIKKYAKEQSRACQLLEEDLMHEMRHVEGCVERIRTRIKENLRSEGNVDGCIVGDVDDYVESFSG